MLAFSSVVSLYRCLQKGLGVTICPEVAVRRYLEEGRLCKLDWDQSDVETPVLMIWHADKWCSPLLKAFMALAIETIR